MESGSQPASTPAPTGRWFAEWIGTLIALLTLAIPLVAITQYSASTEDFAPSPASLPAPR